MHTESHATPPPSRLPRTSYISLNRMFAPALYIHVRNPSLPPGMQVGETSSISVRATPRAGELAADAETARTHSIDEASARLGRHSLGQCQVHFINLLGEGVHLVRVHSQTTDAVPQALVCLSIHHGLALEESKHQEGLLVAKRCSISEAI